jgi:predicted DCC family thiol-disulfide oxidoreductase YuxK
MSSLAPQFAGHSLVLYDGVCGLCHQFVQFVLRRDPTGHFRFCALQDPIAVEILARHGLDPAGLNTVFLVTHPGTSEEQLSERSDAALEVLGRLGGGWRWLVGLLRVIPRPLRDFGYSLVAESRYRVFGRLAVCPLPAPADRDRFLRSR